MGAGFAALLLPAALIVGALAWLQTAPPVKRASPAAVGDAGMVLIGNSKVRSDLDPKRLARDLDWYKGIAVVQLPASTAPAWYATLRDDVFGSGAEPELVVVYGTLAAMLRVEEDTATPSRRRATEAHARLLVAVRNIAVGAVKGDGGFLAPVEGDVDSALERVLGLEAPKRATAPERVIPVAEGDTVPPQDEVPIGETLLVELMHLCQLHNARVLFVRAPLPPALASGDDIRPDRQRLAMRFLRAARAGWVDLTSTGLGAEAFSDNVHLTPIGREANTATLAKVLLAAGFATGGLPEAPMVLVPASAPGPAATAVNLLAGVRDWTDLPPTIGVERETVEGGLRRLHLPGLRSLADDALEARTGTACSPVRIAPADDPTRWRRGAHASLESLASRRSRYAHRGAFLFLPASDTDPLVVGLDLTRSCGAGTWLYPLDRLRITLPRLATARLRQGADRLHFRGIGIPGWREEAEVSIQLRDPDKHTTHFYTRHVLPGTGPSVDWTLAIDPPLPASVPVLVLIENESDGFVLIESAVLAEPEAP